MDVQMRSDTRTGGFSQVYPHVHPVWTINPVKNGLEMLHCLHKFLGLGRIEFCKRILVLVGEEEDMAG